MKTGEVWLMWDEDDRIEAIIGDLNFVRNMKNLEVFNEPNLKDLTPRGSAKIFGRWYRIEQRSVYWSDDKKENE